MNSCKYYDCGWCYAPDDVETSASSQSACLDPDYCPYLKSQMTKEETLECEIKEYTLEIEQKAKEIGKLKDILDRKEQQLKQMKETDISKVLIEGDTATIMGVKYQRIIEPQSFCDKLWGLLRTKIDNPVECSETTDRVLDLIRENIPETYEGVGLGEYSVGWNGGILVVNERLFE